MKLRRQLTAMLFVLIAGSASADTTPDTEWQSVGQAQLRVMFFDIYESSLYTADGVYREDQRPIRLDIHYQRNIRAATLVEQTTREWRHLGVPQENIQAWSERLRDIWPDVRRGDSLSFRIANDGQGVSSYNGTQIGDIENTDLASAFLDIWLSPETSRPEHRQQLIGGIPGESR